MDELEQVQETLRPGTHKNCSHCGQSKPLTEFLRRTGKRSGPGSRRGACRDCRKLRASEQSPASAVSSAPKVKHRSLPSPVLPPTPLLPSMPVSDEIMLKPTRKGFIWMRGLTDRGRRWHQEIELELANLLVKEQMAVIVNRHTIRRLFSNKAFRQYILARDRHICYFCGEFGDTIDHKLPRAKGGHTTPVNCVCACNSCNQSKADQDIESFMNN
ncbi:hypothetical protein J2T15_001350 [Paenibacillus harenae]|uniref:HNH nuclease domain-containing protein n=2 Tax=Paenibacillus harenae TaxID=306543 RepID=A0ABT9TX22_PAEHA|nr:HNH endonuclease signature motif containing protein [Paenibacillus harenae]MDQ0058580.1 hypothetical protein [Paenibacillus harenae]MDQ0111917.1 hypothetical protein [Paenibacillus harenae]